MCQIRHSGLDCVVRFCCMCVHGISCLDPHPVSRIRPDIRLDSSIYAMFQLPKYQLLHLFSLILMHRCRVCRLWKYIHYCQNLDRIHRRIVPVCRPTYQQTKHFWVGRCPIECFVWIAFVDMGRPSIYRWHVWHVLFWWCRKDQPGLHKIFHCRHLLISSDMEYIGLEYIYLFLHRMLISIHRLWHRNHIQS